MSQVTQAPLRITLDFAKKCITSVEREELEKLV